MKPMMKAILAAPLVLAGVTASEPTLAYHTSVHFGFGFGFPGYWSYPAPYYYPPAYPYYNPYYYPASSYPSAPTTYVEQAAPPAPAQPQEQWWYYCVEARAFYPYVRECAGGWQRVSPIPPGG